jgi:hypothetical protein
MKKLFRFVDDLLLLAGCGCALVGISKLSIPATWIIGGLMMIGFAVLVGKAKGKNDLK